MTCLIQIQARVLSHIRSCVCVCVCVCSCCSCCTPEIPGRQFIQLLLIQRPGIDPRSVPAAAAGPESASHSVYTQHMMTWWAYGAFNPQQRTSMLVVTRCVPAPRPPGRRASETSSVVPRGSPRRRTRSPWRFRMTKRPEAAGCWRPAGSTFSSTSSLSVSA